jgi:hypothetical protein
MSIPPSATPAGSLPVVIAEAGVAPTPPASLPLPTGAATAAKQDTANIAMNLLAALIYEGTIPSSSYYYHIADGRIAGHTPAYVTGSRSGIGATAPGTDLWGGTATTCPLMPSAIALEIISSSANDKAGSTGIFSVEVHGLDAAGAMKSETVNMNGAAAVALTGTWTAINGAHGITVGSAGVAIGDIDVRAVVGAVVYSRIPAGRTMDPRVVFTVPAGKKLFFKGVLISGICTSNNNSARIQIVGNIDPETRDVTPGIFHPLAETWVGQGGNAVQIPLELPQWAPAGSTIKARAIRVSGSGTVDASVTCGGWIE